MSQFFIFNLKFKYIFLVTRPCGIKIMNNSIRKYKSSGDKSEIDKLKNTSKKYGHNISSIKECMIKIWAGKTIMVFGSIMRIRRTMEKDI